MFISRDDMAVLSRTGQAQPWNRPLGRDRMVWTAARIWWTVLPGDTAYQPAPARLSLALNHAQDILILPTPPPRRDDLVEARRDRVVAALARVTDALHAPLPTATVPKITIDPQVIPLLVLTGVVQAWAHSLGKNEAVLNAVRAWHFVRDGEDFYRLAPDVVAATFDEACAAFAELDRQSAAGRTHPRAGIAHTA